MLCSAWRRTKQGLGVLIACSCAGRCWRMHQRTSDTASAILWAALHASALRLSQCLQVHRWVLACLQVHCSAELLTCVSPHCLQVYKRVLDKPVCETREAGICMRENDFYVGTVRAFRDRRYEYKGLNKKWKGKLDEARVSGQPSKGWGRLFILTGKVPVSECQCRAEIYAFSCWLRRYLTHVSRTLVRGLVMHGCAT